MWPKVLLAGVLVSGLGMVVLYGRERKVKEVSGERDRQDMAAGRIALPQAQMEDGMSLLAALTSRRSVREFGPKGLTEAELGQLCWAAQGVTEPVRGLRTAPSAGALYPLTVFVVDSNGVFVYQVREHTLERVALGDRRQELQMAALGQSAVGAAPVCMVVAMNVRRTARKYGGRAERYCLMEAGHVAQNVLLQATALGLAAVPIGAFEDGKVKQILGLGRELEVVYLIPLGHVRSE